MSDLYTFECPHCGGMVQVMPGDIRCKFFRHGIYRNGTPLSPHSSKEICDDVFKNGKIYGCGKPFKFDGKNVEICDYI